MNIPLVDLKAQYRAIQPEVDGAVQRVLDKASFILGPEVNSFEAAFADYCDAAGCVGVASGTAALQLALMACGVGPGDEVITASHTFIATAEAIAWAGARPVLVDIDPETYTLDPDRVAAAVTDRTRAVVPVHLYGYPADMVALAEIAERHGLWLIEDAAQAHGAEIDGRRVGGLGHLGCFSFYPGKNLGAYGDAGAVTGNDAALLDRVRSLRNHGRSRAKYEHEEIGFGERLDALQAAVLAAKLPHLEDWTNARRAHAARYGELLAGAPVRLPCAAATSRHVYHLYVVQVRDRDGLLQHLKAEGIQAGIHYPVPLHRQPALAALGYGELKLPNTEAAAAAIVSLPMYPELTDEQLVRVATAVREYVER